MVNFTRLAIASDNGLTVALQAECRIGCVLIPSPVDFSVRILGCPPGQAPVGFACKPCRDGLFSRGGADRECNACPRRGAACRGGSLLLAQGFYRPPSEAALPIASNSTLIPYPIAGTCLFNSSADGVASTVAGGAFTCAEGYSGPLCSVCDRSNGYARFGAACGRCWSPAASGLVVALAIIAIVAALIIVAAMSGSQGSRSPGSIALRILLTYVQSLGAIRAFRAGGSELFKQAFSFTEIVSASPFSSGPIDCALGWSWLTRFLVTETMPFLAAVGVILCFLVLITARSARCNAAATKLCRSCSARRSGKSVVAASALPPAQATSTPSPAIDSSAAVPTASSSASSNSTASTSASASGGWRASIHAFWLQRKHVTVTIYLLAFGFAPMVTTAFRALDCDEEAIDGVRYLHSDRTVACDSRAHSFARAVAISVIIIVGVGFPLWLFLSLWRASVRKLQQPGFRAAWGSLSDGYRWLSDKDSGSSDRLLLHQPKVAVDDAASASSVVWHAGGSATSRSKQRTSASASASIGEAADSFGSSRVSASDREPLPCGCCERHCNSAARCCCGWRQRGISCCGRRYCKSGILFRHLLWFESVILLRKLILVLLATLVADASVQLSGVAALMLACLLLQLQLMPYSRWIFNALETAALLSALATAIVSAVLLRSTAEAEAAAAAGLLGGGPASVTAGTDGGSVTGIGSGSSGLASGFTFAGKETAATVILIILNGATLALLCVTVAWLYVSDCLRSPAVHKAMAGLQSRMMGLRTKGYSAQKQAGASQATPAAGVQMQRLSRGVPAAAAGNSSKGSTQHRDAVQVPERKAVSGGVVARSGSGSGSGSRSIFSPALTDTDGNGGSGRRGSEVFAVNPLASALSASGVVNPLAGAANVAATPAPLAPAPGRVLEPVASTAPSGSADSAAAAIHARARRVSVAAGRHSAAAALSSSSSSPSLPAITSRSGSAPPPASSFPDAAAAADTRPVMIALESDLGTGENDTVARVAQNAPCPVAAGAVGASTKLSVRESGDERLEFGPVALHR